MPVVSPCPMNHVLLTFVNSVLQDCRPHSQTDLPFFSSGIAAIRIEKLVGLIAGRFLVSRVYGGSESAENRQWSQRRERACDKAQIELNGHPV